MPARVMVIDDTQEVLELFREILTEEGYEVVLYSYGIQDMGEVERVKPDLIVLDHIFGEERVGWQMLQKLKMRRATENIPVVVCTAALRQLQELEGYLKAHGVQVVPKPFGIDDLLHAVKQGLQARRDAVSLGDPGATPGSGTSDLAGEY